MEIKAQSGQSLELHPRLGPLLPWFSAPLSHSDVRFVVGQERQEVFAHRCLLACRCNFFQRLLGQEPGPGVPSPVVLSTVPAEAFLAVLEFLYTNSIKLQRHSVLEVLTAAVEYGLEELREEALRTRGFLELSAPALLPLLRSDNLCVDEAELVLAARSWARVGAAVLERPVAEVAAPVVRELRLALLAPAELSALEEQNRREPLIPVRTRGTRWSRLWRRGSAMLCGEGMRPGMPRAGAGGAPCPGSITAFWTCPLSDQRPRLTRNSGAASNYTSRRARRSALGGRFRSQHAGRARRGKNRCGRSASPCGWGLGGGEGGRERKKGRGLGLGLVPWPPQKPKVIFLAPNPVSTPRYLGHAHPSRLLF
ncbi:BTB/POZ domain-containing protein 19 isoform 4-T4 [Hipposideros larvatus]